jgi:hypothetical protein
MLVSLLVRLCCLTRQKAFLTLAASSAGAGAQRACQLSNGADGQMAVPACKLQLVHPRAPHVVVPCCCSIINSCLLGARLGTHAFLPVWGLGCYSVSRHTAPGYWPLG